MDNSSVDNWEPSSPNVYSAYGRDQYKHHRLRTHSLTPERLTKSSVTMTTDTDEVVNSKQASRRKRYKSSSKQLSCDDKADNGDVTNSVDHANVPSSEIMSSLNKINSQLGEVLTRLTHPSTTTSSIQPYPSADPLLQPRRPDKTEEELRSKWLYYLGKELSLFIIEFLNWISAVVKAYSKGCYVNLVKPSGYLRPSQGLLKSSKHIHLRHLYYKQHLCGT